MQAAIIIIIQLSRIFNAVIYFIRSYQVLIKRIIEIKMIVLLKVELGKIAMDKMRILQAQHLTGSIGMRHQVFPLFYADKAGRWYIIRRRQAEFPHPAADIQYPVLV